MLDLVRKRAFVITGAVFLIYGVTAMGGGPSGAATTESVVMPKINPEFLRLRQLDEILSPVFGDPFRSGRPAPPEVPVGGEGEGPWASQEPRLDPSPVPPVVDGVAPENAGEIPAEVLAAWEEQQRRKEDGRRPDKPLWLYGLPEGDIFELNSTLDGAGVRAARINGVLLQVGEKLSVAGAQAVLERVEGSTAVVSWRDLEIRLDLYTRPTVSAQQLPIDV